MTGETARPLEEEPAWASGRQLVMLRDFTRAHGDLATYARGLPRPPLTAGDYLGWTTWLLARFGTGRPAKPMQKRYAVAAEIRALPIVFGAVMGRGEGGIHPNPQRVVGR